MWNTAKLFRNDLNAPSMMGRMSRFKGNRTIPCLDHDLILEGAPKVAAIVWCFQKIPKACLRVPVSWCYLATAWNHSYIGWYPSFLGQSSWQAGRWTVAFMTALDGNEYWCVQNLMVLQFQSGETDDVCHNAFGVHNFQATPPKK
jgi:hypothetical protein